MIHYYSTLILVIINGLFIGRAIYLVTKNQSPSTIDFLSRRLSSYSYMLALASLVKYPFNSSHAIAHAVLLMLPALLPFIFIFLRPLRQRYPLLHPILHYLLIVGSFILI